MASSRLPGPAGLTTPGDVPRTVAGPSCRQLPPLPGPVQAGLDDLRAARQGTPYAVSPRHVVRNALDARHRQILAALAVADSSVEIACLKSQWLRARHDYEALLQEPLRYDPEPDGDADVEAVVKDLLDPSFIRSVTLEIVESALRDESVRIDRILLDAIVDEARDWVAQTLPEVLKGWGVRLIDRRIRRPTKRQAASLATVLRKAHARVGRPLSDYDAQRLARRILDRIAQPTASLARVAGRIAAAYASAPLVALRVFLTPSRTASRRLDEDPNPALSGAIDDAIDAALQRALERESRGDRLAPATAGPTLRSG